MTTPDLSTPAGGSTPPPQGRRRRRGQLDGERLKDRALGVLQARRAAYILMGRRALLARLLADGVATADDVRDAVKLPPGMNPNLFGVIPGALATLGIIRRKGFVKSARPIRHAAFVAVWELLDAAKAQAWLDDNPERGDDHDDTNDDINHDDDHDAPSAALDPAPDPTPAGGHAAAQGDLFADESEEPEAATSGSKGGQGEHNAEILA